MKNPVWTHLASFLLIRDGLLYVVLRFFHVVTRLLDVRIDPVHHLALKETNPSEPEASQRLTQSRGCGGGGTAPEPPPPWPGTGTSGAAP